jgi:hypothetical protein
MADNDAVLTNALGKTIHRLVVSGVALTALLITALLVGYAAPRGGQATQVFACILAGLAIYVLFYGALTTMLVRWLAKRWEHVALIHAVCIGVSAFPIAAVALMFFGFA